MIIFLDANVLFTAAHNPNGKAALVIQLGKAGIWLLATSRYAIEEARRNLIRKYPYCIKTFDEMMAGIKLAPDSPSVPCPTGLAVKDQPIYRAAVGCHANYLLTGDIKDFGFLMQQSAPAVDVIVQTVATFLNSITSQQLDFPRKSG